MAVTQISNIPHMQTEITQSTKPTTYDETQFLQHLEVNQQPNTQRVYQNPLSKISSYVNNVSDSSVTKTGTDIALEKSNAELKKVAEDFEQQIYALMWKRVFTAADTKEPGSSVNALDMLGPELMDQIIKSGMDKDSMGNLAQRIYEDLIRARDGNIPNSKLQNKEV